MITNNPNIRAYTAGYIDGDGCIYLGKFIQKPKLITVYEYSIQIVSVKREVLDWLQGIYGGSVKKKPFKEKHRDTFCLTVKGRESAYLAQAIQFFLVEKKDQCSMLVQFSWLIHCNQFKPVDQNLLNKREELINNIRKDKHMNNLITKESIDSLTDRKLTVTPCEEDYAYLAGLIDSEGCFRIKKWKPKNKPNHAYNISVEIGNTKLPILPWLVERFGGSVVFIPAKTNKRSSATWTLSAAALYEILPKIGLFLTSKKEVCDKLIEFQKTILPNGGDRHSELFRALFEKRMKIRERIINEVHKFN
ncbi:MAG: 2 protein, partial [Candidatus Poribacteria bacterium]|nr:2 protein [Candidatus Poribacteria bacterium]